MTALKTAVLWCCRLEIPWRAEDVAQIAGNHPAAVRAYLNRLAQASPAPVRRLPDGSYAAGNPDAIAVLRTTPSNPKDGGNGAAYRRARAVRDRLLTAEANARRLGGLLTSQTVSNRLKPSQSVQPDFSGGSLTGEDVCRLLNISRASLFRLAAAGRLPFGRLPGGHRRYGAADVQRFLDVVAGAAGQRCGS